MHQRRRPPVVLALLILVLASPCVFVSVAGSAAGDREPGSTKLRGSVTATSWREANGGKRTPSFGPGMPSCGSSHTIPPLDAASAARNPQLVQVQAFIRHGDRTPFSAGTCWSGQHDDPVWACPLSQLQRNNVAPRNSTSTNTSRMYDLEWDPRREALRGNCGLVQLTSIGAAQQHGNGEGLASAYVKSGVLPSSYFGNEDAFFLRSDDTDRTIQSGQALFTGMYPPATEGDAEVVGWNVMDSTYDPIGFNAQLCPALTSEMAAAIDSPATKNFTATMQPFMDALAQELGTKVSRDFFYFMQDCGITHACHNHPVPTALSANFSTILRATYTQWRLFFTYGNVTRFIVGPLVNRTWTNMKAVMRGEPSAKRFRLISGHDLTPIMPLLFAYGVEDGTWSYYASLIALELYKVESSWAVRMVYNDNAVHIRGCDAVLCDIAQFAAVTESIIPTAAECGISTAAAAPTRRLAELTAAATLHSSLSKAQPRLDRATRLVNPLARRARAL